MHILERVRQGYCYIKTKDDHELAIVINFFLTHKIWFMSEIKVSDFHFYGTGQIIYVEPIYSRLLIGMTYSEQALIRENHIDITEQFFNEITA